MDKVERRRPRERGRRTGGGAQPEVLSEAPPTARNPLSPLSGNSPRARPLVQLGGGAGPEPLTAVVAGKIGPLVRPIQGGSGRGGWEEERVGD